MVYGNFDGKMVNEETPCNPIGIYGALKYSGEKLVAYNQVFDLPYTIIRPSALYGERCVSRRVGQVLENALQGKNLTLNGDGLEKLDFTYISDLLQGVIKTIESPKSKNQVFNITFGEGNEILKMANIVLEHFPKIKIEYLPRDNLVPERGALSIEKAKELIDYRPQYPLEVGIQNI